MNLGTIKAALALLFQKWPWPDESEDFQESYVARLKLQVISWDRKREEGFKRAVDSLVADNRQRGRPSPEQIVALALSKCGVAPPAAVEERKPGPYPGGFFVAPEERKKAAETLRAWHLKNRARMAASPMFGPDPFGVTPDDVAAALSPGELPGGGAEREQAHRERVREDAKDRREEQGEDCSFASIPFVLLLAVLVLA